MFRIWAYHKSGFIQKVYDRNMKCVTQFHHALGLLRTCCGHGTGKVFTIIRNDSHHSAIEPRKTSDLTLTVKG